MPMAARRFLLALALVVAAGPALSALEVPALAGRVNDYADMISATSEQSIAQKLEALEASDSTQVVVLTVPSLDGEDMEGFSIRVAEAWKIGTARRTTTASSSSCPGTTAWCASRSATAWKES